MNWRPTAATALCAASRVTGCKVYPAERDFIEITRAAQLNTVMLLTIAVLLFILWLLGLVSSYTLGGLIHLLLVVAIIAVLIRIIQGRPAI